MVQDLSNVAVQGPDRYRMAPREIATLNRGILLEIIRGAPGGMRSSSWCYLAQGKGVSLASFINQRWNLVQDGLVEDVDAGSFDGRFRAILPEEEKVEAGNKEETPVQSASLPVGWKDVSDEDLDLSILGAVVQYEREGITETELREGFGLSLDQFHSSFRRLVFRGLVEVKVVDHAVSTETGRAYLEDMTGPLKLETEDEVGGEIEHLNEVPQDFFDRVRGVSSRAEPSLIKQVIHNWDIEDMDRLYRLTVGGLTRSEMYLSQICDLLQKQEKPLFDISDLNSHSGRTRLGKKLVRFNGRELSGITMRIDRSDKFRPRYIFTTGSANGATCDRNGVSDLNGNLTKKNGHSVYPVRVVEECQTVYADRDEWFYKPQPGSGRDRKDFCCTDCRYSLKEALLARIAVYHCLGCGWHVYPIIRAEGLDRFTPSKN